ncbi:MAG: hypothetical protein H8E21_18065 [Gammaproteobacteria bacterium]|nr:hypothetical protein [Gammaproteobacteria bacterium]MBL7000639.1 hypothetical protein [Gammaproteobacteria bacterium]
MLTENCREAVLSEIGQRRLPADFMSTVERWYLPLAQFINDCYRHKQNPLLVSFNGAQGSGKSTITAFLTLLLQQQFELFSVEISIDDFYLTHAQRQQLAQQVHPLFATRGVPGTHDVALAQQTLQCLRNCSEQSPCRLPRFDKSIDDRMDASAWISVRQPVKVILFEGWCNHAPVQSEQQLQQPVNELERDEDASGVWRRYANDQLALYHRRLFDQAELKIFLQAPNFEKVYEWRGLQEQKLALDSTKNNHAVMNPEQLKRFIQHYERITRYSLEQLPASADVVLTLDDDHAISGLKLKEC